MYQTGDILVVDDNPANLLAIEAALGELGGELITVRSGADALRHLLHRDFALVVLDIQMPSMDGFETARLIRSRGRNRHLPIIFVTAYNRDDQDILTGYALGAVDFLFKPIVPEVLRAKAAVFVELQRHTAEISRQAELLRQHERREHERRLIEEKQKWEAESLRQQMEEQRRAAEEIAHKADELATTVAEKQEAEAALLRTNQRLEETDRRKDEFLAVLAHELRNPLAPIVNSLELLKNADLGDPMLDRARAAMGRQVKHLARLVDDLLDVSRITSGKIELREEPVDLDHIVEQAVIMCRPIIDERRHELVVHSCQTPLPISADTVRLTQVITNLITNAARYTQPGGHISIRCSRDNDMAVTEVGDNGQGISEQLLGRIFEPFVQESAGGGGLGVGLTLVKRLVEMHGGRILAHSAGIGHGSVFTMRLPLAIGDQAVAAETACVTHAEDAGFAPPLRIVVVEDNDDIRQTLCDLLELWGHHVDTANDGARGVDTILRVRPDVALVDIGLPTLDGYSVAQRVCAAIPDARPRLIAMTGFGQDSDRQRAAAAGFDGHLVKPVEIAMLQHSLATTQHGN